MIMEEYEREVDLHYSDWSHREFFICDDRTFSLIVPSRSNGAAIFQIVFHDRIAVISKDRFGMELDAEGGDFFVHDAHDGAVGG